MAALNIVEAIRSRADLMATAVVQSGRELSYGELLKRSSELAEALPRRVGVPLRVGLRHASGLDYIAYALAILEAGHCFVPLPEELSGPELLALMENTALDGVLSAGPVYERLEPGVPGFSLEELGALNPAFIRFSSGTTGRSKGIVLSHETLLERIAVANGGLRIGPGSRVLWALPMAHHFAVSIILYLYYGAVTVVEEQRLGADLLLSGREHEVTHMYGSPVHYRQLTAAAAGWTELPWPGLKLAVSTAAALDAATARCFHERFGQPLVQGLGIIEVGLPLLNLDGAADQPECLGRPLPGCEARITEPDAEGVGQLWLRAPGMLDAYLHPWQCRAEVLDGEGWFATGDLALCDAGGRYQLRGRCGSVINCGGMKIFPEEVEAVLEGHASVGRCLVQGRPHALYGEVPVALVLPAVVGEALDLAALRRHCAGQLARYKVPLTFTAVTALPMTASGKLLRRPLAI
jgi:long-chain acyl-CoA synthetase